MQRKNLYRGIKRIPVILALSITLLLTNGCSNPAGREPNTHAVITAYTDEEATTVKNNLPATETTKNNNAQTEKAGKEASISLPDIPAYSGSPYTVINGNTPLFQESDLTTTPFEHYSDLDSLGRCGVAEANICKEIMPTEKRGEIGMVKPSGWHTVKYDGIDGKYLYNRCHLIGYQLSGENANEKNLITGTRYLNVQGMLPFENMAADYVKETGHHVLYRVTPVFKGNNLVASGVLMEAESVEDKGEGIMFCVYCYNVQPGIEINYADGTSREAEDTEQAENTGQGRTQNSGSTSSHQEAEEAKYVGNKNTKKFHKPSCPSAEKIAAGNKTVFASRDEAVSDGYSPCGICRP